MTTAAYYRHIRSIAPFRAIDAFALAKEAAALDASRPRVSAGPELVCWEDGLVRLSFAVKVF